MKKKLKKKSKNHQTTKNSLFRTPVFGHKNHWIVFKFAYDVKIVPTKLHQSLLPDISFPCSSSEPVSFIFEHRSKYRQVRSINVKKVSQLFFWKAGVQKSE